MALPDGRGIQAGGSTAEGMSLSLAAEADLMVAVSDRCPARKRGIEVALEDGGFVVDSPDDLRAWVASPGAGAAIVHVDRELDVECLETLARRTKDAVLVALIAELTSSALERVMSAGASAAVAEDAAVGNIVAVVGAALCGWTLMPSDIAKALVEHRDPELTLSALEVAWLRQLADGTTIAKLARESNYSERAMYRHLSVLYRMLGAASKTEAVLAASRLGLI